MRAAAVTRVTHATHALAPPRPRAVRLVANARITTAAARARPLRTTVAHSRRLSRDDDSDEARAVAVDPSGDSGDDDGDGAVAGVPSSPPLPPPPVLRPPRVIYEDANVLAVDKPSVRGLAPCLISPHYFCSQNTS
jgi:23S rRNA-/tRNA-specific pseudouridylate synthase